MKLVYLIGFCMVLLVFSVNGEYVEVGEAIDGPGSLGVFTASILDYSPAVIPAIALEHRSNSFVNLDIGIFETDILPGITYEIESVSIIMSTIPDA